MYGANCGRFPKISGNQYKGTKTSIQIRYTRKQRTTIIHKMFETLVFMSILGKV